MYFANGSPETNDDPRFEAPKPGDLMEREVALNNWLVYAYAVDTGELEWISEVSDGEPQSDRPLIHI